MKKSGVLGVTIVGIILAVYAIVVSTTLLGGREVIIRILSFFSKISHTIRRLWRKMWIYEVRI